MGLAKTASGSKGIKILQTLNIAKKNQKFWLVESILLCLQTTPIYYVKYRNKESEDKALGELINEEWVAWGGV